MRPVWMAIATMTCLALAGCGSAPDQGRAVYDERCAICHGPGGKGDGRFAAQLIRMPPDLTIMARENGGTFPRARVTQSIDGYARGDHFSGAMPEFGPLLAGGDMLESGDGEISPPPQLLVAVVDYLESLQQ